MTETPAPETPAVEAPKGGGLEALFFPDPDPEWLQTDRRPELTFMVADRLDPSAVQLFEAYANLWERLARMWWDSLSPYKQRKARTRARDGLAPWGDGEAPWQQTFIDLAGLALLKALRRHGYEELAQRAQELGWNLPSEKKEEKCELRI